MSSADRKAEDYELVRRTLDGDSDAFNKLYTRYREKVYRVAYHLLGSREDALDQVQEAFIRAHRALANFKGESSFETWLLRITTNRCLDFRRMSRRRRIASIDDQEFDISRVEPRTSPQAETPVQELEEEELRSAITEGLRELSEDHRTVILLHAFQKMRYREIADHLGISEGTVMSRLFHARKSLHKILTRKGVIAEGAERKADN
jgi:RNA polymerase sigma-70 factor (ECF subfamily)